MNFISRYNLLQRWLPLCQSIQSHAFSEIAYQSHGRCWNNFHAQSCSPWTFQRNSYCHSRTEKLPHWDKAVSAAEKVVGYPTSFMNLRFWLSDEMSNVAVNMRKLIGTNHPLMKTAKGLLFDNKENMQTRGLIVLLISKAGGHPDEQRVFTHHHLDNTYSPAVKPDAGQSHSNGIITTQRSLAEITEMINTAFVLHRGVMDIDLSSKQKPFDSETEDLLYGNKMSLLSGDYLLAKASAGLAALGNTYVVEIMASAIADLMESRFYIDDLSESKQDLHLTLDQWEELTYKTGGCLYAKSCQSALMLSHHPESVSNAAFSFGKHFGMLRQMKADVDNAGDLQYSIQSILSSKDLEDVKQHYVNQAIDALKVLTNFEATNALKDVVLALSTSISYS